MNYEQADQILLSLKAAFPHADANIDPLQAKARDAIYRKALLAWNEKTAREAAQACVLSSRFYPTVAELHEAYSAAARARPDLATNALPPADGTVATPEQVKAACAAGIAAVMANAVVPEKRVVLTTDPPVAEPEEERAMIERTIARARESGDRS